MKIICLVGEIGTGKTTVAEMLENLGAEVIYSDDIAKAISLNPKYKAKLSRTFGKNILYKNGRLNRKKLAKIVFSNKNKLKKLDRIMLPLIIKELKKILSEKSRLEKLLKKEKKKEMKVVLEAPLLFRTNLYNRCDEILYITCPEDLRIERVISKMNLSKEEAKLRVEGQDLIIPKDKVHYIINNNKGINHLRREIGKFCRHIQSKT